MGECYFIGKKAIPSSGMTVFLLLQVAGEKALIQMFHRITILVAVINGISTGPLQMVRQDEKKIY